MKSLWKAHQQTAQRRGAERMVEGQMVAQKGLIWDRMLDFAGVGAENSLVLLFG